VPSISGRVEKAFGVMNFMGIPQMRRGIDHVSRAAPTA